VLGNRWLMLALILVARVSMALQFQSIAPVAPLVVADLGITYTQVGLLIGLYLLPGTVLALPGGMLGHRYGNRRMALWGLGLMVCGGLATAGSYSFWLACAGRILSGAGGVLLTLILTKMTAEWFAGKEISTAMSLMLSGWPLGIGLGTAFFGAVAAHSSWRSVQHLVTSTATLAFMLLTLCYRDAPGAGTPAAALRLWPRLPARAWALALAAGAAWASFNVGLIVLVGFGPAVLTAQGASLAQAGFLTSLVLWAIAISAPLGGALTDRTGRPNLAITLGCITTAIAIVALPLLPGAVLWLLVAGLMMGLPPGAIVALVPESVRPEHLAAAFGLFYATYYLGMAAMQPVAGLVRDLYGSPAAPMFFAAAMMVITIVALGAFRWISRHPP
jgi:MFS family permease